MMPTPLIRSPHGLQVRVLERRAQHAHLVDVLAGRHQLAHDLRARPRGARPRTARVPFAVSTSTPPARLSSSGVPAATSSPRAMIATRSHTSSTSDSRCEFSSTATPWPRSSSSSRRTVRRPAGIERAGRLVEQQHPRAADHRLRDPQPLLHALGHRAHAARRSPPPGRPLEQAHALARAAVRARQPLVHAEQLVRGQPVREAEQLGEVAERAVRGRRAGRRAGDLTPSRRSAARARRRSSRASTCRRRWGPSSPTSSPSPTSSATPFSASIEP